MITNPMVRPVLSRDGSKLASAAPDQWIAVLDLESGWEFATLGGGQPRSNRCASLQPLRRSLGERKKENTFIRRDATGGTEMATPQAYLGPTVMRIPFSPRRDSVAEIVEDAGSEVWIPKKGGASVVLSGPSETVTEVAFSGGAKFLADVVPTMLMRQPQIGQPPSIKRN